VAEVSTIARPYASAIFKIAKDNKELANWSDFLSLLSAVISDETMGAYLQDAKVFDTDREKILTDLTKNQMVKHGENLIKLLIENKRLMVLPAIASHYEELKSVEEGAIEAQIIVAEKPDAKIINNLVSSLEKKFNKKIESNVVVDKSIIGGTKIIVGDSVIDASVKGQLNSLAYTLKS
jgi:F-type H+-transporting ATPase subunit delta